jgi:hypothetical protein
VAACNRGVAEENQVAVAAVESQAAAEDAAGQWRPEAVVVYPGPAVRRRSAGQSCHLMQCNSGLVDWLGNKAFPQMPRLQMQKGSKRLQNPRSKTAS